MALHVIPVDGVAHQPAAYCPCPPRREVGVRLTPDRSRWHGITYVHQELEVADVGGDFLAQAAAVGVHMVGPSAAAREAMAALP